MPILAGAAAPPAPPAPPRPHPKRITWTSPGGDVLDLSGGQGYVCMPGRSGFGVVEREVKYDALPDGGGALRGIVDQVRVIGIPLRVQGSTQQEYLVARARLQESVRHRRGGGFVPGTITVQRPDGSRRSISALYQGGLSGEEDPLDDLLLRMAEFPALEFIALDPYWVGGTVEDSWRSDTGVSWFGPMPLRLSPSAVLGEVTTTLPGDADSYPVWTFTGPGVPIVTNLTSGRTWRFKADAPIAAGRTVTVDTRPDQLTVTDDLGADLYGWLQPFPDFWPLEPGENVLQVEMTGSDTDSSAAYSADVRWQAGW